MVHLKAGIAALLVAVSVSGCASVETADAQAASGMHPDTKGLITGSRLPRKASENTQAVRSVSPEEWTRYQPPAPINSN